ncbi:MAG: GHKL domain-containing protein, partial [Bacteroidetes bacterium]|nr:GHKL domain-containing protein [Bacteroidota bacterium]
LFVNSFFFLFLSYSFDQFRKKTANNMTNSQLRRIVSLSILILTFFIIFHLYEYVIISLFKNSQVSIEFGQDFIAHRSITIISFFIACSFSLAVYFFGRVILLEIYEQFHKRIQRYLVGAGILIGYAIITYVFSELVFSTVLLIGGFTFMILFLEEKDSKITSLNIISFLLIFALYLGFLSSDILTKKEFEQRTVMAESIAGDRDPMAEYVFEKLIDKIYGDSIILKTVYHLDKDNNELNIIHRIEGIFDAEASINYKPRITICDSATFLSFNTDDYMVSCATYFSEIISEFGNATNKRDLFYFRNNSINNSYIIRLFFPQIDKEAGRFIFIELDSEFIQEGLGYPELLIDEASNISGAELVNYSMAKYKQNELVYKFGDYDYSANLQYYQELKDRSNQFESNGYNHILINKDEETNFIISKENKDLIDILAPFSYFFIFLAFFLTSFYMLTGFSYKIFNIQISFRNRLQFTLFGIILTSFLVIGVTTLLFLVQLNDKKNNEILSEKAHSVLVELDHKLAGADSISPAMYETLNGWLGKFSLVFFSDINLYSLDGRLIASSRLPLFDVGLISKLMNVTAYDVLAKKEKLLFIQNEKIGEYEYLSAYVPFRNSQNKLIAYLNLPYFARQKELQTEITSFLVALFNIYVLFFIIALLVTMVISRRISKPLLLIRQSISGIRLGKSNEKIKWDRKDEIGGLVTEYNRMIDELSKSANLLARSERESAWREMAKQVAHEIKNPLTPLKLSVQYLKKAWDENEKDWDQRLNRFTKTSIEQIDSLSDIASAFSDFAKMPVQKMEPVDLKKIIHNAVGLFKEDSTVEYVLHLPENEYIIIADKNQLLRVFNNLFKNSIQALASKKDGQITISVKKSNSELIVIVADNGSGISKEMSDKIFTPSFTTKTSGMGLGLAIVRNIIVNTGGDIWFESETGIGSTFYISFPQPILEADVV